MKQRLRRIRTRTTRTESFARGAEPLQPRFIFGPELRFELLPKTLRERRAFAVRGNGESANRRAGRRLRSKNGSARCHRRRCTRFRALPPREKRLRLLRVRRSPRLSEKRHPESAGSNSFGSQSILPKRTHSAICGVMDGAIRRMRAPAASTPGILASAIFPPPMTTIRRPSSFTKIGKEAHGLAFHSLRNRPQR